MDTMISSVAGNGNQGYSGDGDLATDSTMDNPFHVEIDRAEQFLYFADCFNFRVRRVNLHTGIIENFAGVGTQGHSGDGGLAKLAEIDEIYAVQVDSNGDVYICQRFNPSIRKIDGSTGIITTVAGTGQPGSGDDNVIATESELMEPNDCVLDHQGALLIADVKDQKVRKLNLKTGLITTFAGTGVKEHTGDGGLASTAGIHGARAICVDSLGNTYICEREGNTVRRVDKSGTITTVAGTGEKGYTGDHGPSIEAEFNGPKAIRCDQFGNVIIVDTENHAVRIADVSTGKISTVAGGSVGPHGDGGDPLEAGLARPHGAITGRDGSMYIADSENHRIRLVKRR